MIMDIRTLVLCFLVAAQWSSRAAAEDVVYTWIDDDGVTHFSDAPPGKAGATLGDVESMTMPDGFPEPTDAGENYYSIANQWQRMQEERAAREELALERKRLRIEEVRTERAAVSASDSGKDSPTVVYGGWLHHPRFPAFARNRHGFFGHRGIKAGFGRKVHHDTSQRSFRHGPRRQQNSVGNHSTVNETGSGFSGVGSHGLGSAGK